MNFQSLNPEPPASFSLSAPSLISEWDRPPRHAYATSLAKAIPFCLGMALAFCLAFAVL